MAKYYYFGPDYQKKNRADAYVDYDYYSFRKKQKGNVPFINVNCHCDCGTSSQPSLPSFPPATPAPPRNSP